MAFVVHHAVIWYVFAMIPFLPADIMLSALWLLICSLHAEMPAASMDTRAVRLCFPLSMKERRFHIVSTCEGMQG